MNEINIDNGGRRSGIDRRQFSYSGYLPERRSGNERRSGRDRRETLREKKKPDAADGKTHKTDTIGDQFKDEKLFI